MCDYSLNFVASRPAKVGDRLVSTQFRNSITRGFAAIGEPHVAVCLLPGTELAFENEVAYDPALGSFLPNRPARTRLSLLGGATARTWARGRRQVSRHLAAPRREKREVTRRGKMRIPQGCACSSSRIAPARGLLKLGLFRRSRVGRRTPAGGAQTPVAATPSSRDGGPRGAGYSPPFLALSLP